MKNNHSVTTKNTAITCVCKDSVGENKAFAKLLSAYTSSTCTEVLEQLQKIKTGGAGGAALRFNVFGAATRPVEVSALETQCLQIGSEKITGILLGGMVKEMGLIDGSDANGLTEKEIYGVQVNKDKLQGYNEYATKEQRGLVQYKPNNLADYMILLSEKDEDQYNRQLKALKEYLGIVDDKSKTEDEEEFGSISDLPPAIAPSNGTTNFRGGTFGCTRTMEIPNLDSDKRRFCIRCNNCTPLPNSPNLTKRFHDGIDISLPFGTPIKAIITGVITKVVKNNSDKLGLGSYVEITSIVKDQTIVIRYGHLNSEGFSLNQQPLTAGVKIKKGDVFAITGNTGNISSIKNIPTIQQHTHIQVPIDNEKVNPKSFMNPKLKSIIEAYE